MMEVNTDLYRFQYGRAPRGVGQWAFSVFKNPQAEHIFFVNGAYGDAKREAVRRIEAALGKGKVSVLYLQP